MKNISVIYQIQSKINGKRYVGSAINYGSRITTHLSKLHLNKHHSILLQNHTNKYGIEDLQFSILEPVMFKEDLISREQYYIDTLKPEFNICKIAGNTLGRKLSEEAKKKVSLANKGKICSDETKRKMGAWQIGRKRPESTIAKMRKINLGKKVSEETKRKMSEAQKRRLPCSNETKEKISKANKGKIFSEEHKIKLSLAGKGKKPITSQKIIDIKTGVIYLSISDAAKSINMVRETFRRKLKNIYPNTTNLRYYQPE